MLKKITLASFCLIIAIAAGCSSTTDDAKKSADEKKLPEGIEAKPIQPDGKQTPGIPDPKDAKLKELPKGATPTPGIPDPKTIGKTPVPKGATPTPGIPSEEELKKMRERKVDPSEVNKPKKGSKPVSDKEVTSPIDRKRRVGKSSNR